MERPSDENQVEESPGTDMNVEAVDIVYRDEEAPMIASFKDHFTLSLPTSTIRYREHQCAARVIEGLDDQIVLEETYDPETKTKEISIRRIHDSSEGLKILRFSYALVTAFWTIFLFIFCLQLLLFAFLDLALKMGATTGQSARYGAALGVIFSIIMLVYSLASAMVLAGAYIKDTWQGHYLIRNFVFRNMKEVTVEWIFFLFFLGIPVFIMAVTLLAKLDNWWSITSLFWFSCVSAFYVIFVVHVVFYEVKACWAVSKNIRDNDDDSFWPRVRRSILMRQVSTYGGRKEVTYLSMGSIPDSEYTDKCDRKNMVPNSYKETMSYRAKFTTWKQLVGLYEILDKPQRLYTVDDARDDRPFLTAHTWGLEKIFCRPKNSRYIAIVGGPGAITTSQFRSSLACSILGTALIFLVTLASLVYLRLGAVFTGFMCAVFFLIAFPTIQNTYNLYSSGRHLLDARAEGKRLEKNRQSEAVYLVQEYYRMTRPTEKMCWFMFGLELFFFFFWPLGSYFGVNNYPLGILYFVAAGVTGFRYYINAAVVLEETGDIKIATEGSDEEAWREQSRLNEIVGNITRGRSRAIWNVVLGALGFIFLGLFAGALGTQQESSPSANTDTGYTYLPGFYYEQRDSLRYPTCQLTNELGTSPIRSMADFAFLAGVAYRGTGLTQTELNGYFYNETAIDEYEKVQAYRNNSQVSSAVSFKQITFPGANNFTYMSIRGTQNNWDMLTDTQLWSAAALFQVFRAVLPIGQIWTPIMDQLINAITTVESSAIESVSFYKDTTKFVEYLKQGVDSGLYSGVAITGHSLGGGLSIISGAQTQTVAVALSGPNAVLSRKSFDPKVSKEQLDRFTFNIIPQRDVVPMIDDVAQNWQSIRCLTGPTDFIGCHDSTRSLCEILYTCGTNGRPAICECVTLYGYPQPLSFDGSQTFEQACGITSS